MVKVKLKADQVGGKKCCVFNTFQIDLCTKMVAQHFTRDEVIHFISVIFLVMVLKL